MDTARQQRQLLQLYHHESSHHIVEGGRAVHAPSAHIHDWSEQPLLHRVYGGPLVDVPSWQSVLATALAVSRRGRSSEKRVNPSAGNLHPEECLALDRGRVLHYLPGTNQLEDVGHATGGGGGGEDGSAVLGILPYRTVWKYGPRGLRYALLDAGHALGALAVALLLCGKGLCFVGPAPLVHGDRSKGPDRQLLLFSVVLREHNGGQQTTLVMERQPSTVVVEQHPVARWCLTDELVQMLLKDAPQVTVPGVVLQHVGFTKEAVMRRSSAKRFAPGVGSCCLREFAAKLAQARNWHHVQVHFIVHKEDDVPLGIYDMELQPLQLGDYRHLSFRMCGQSLASDGLFHCIISAHSAGSLEAESLGAYVSAHVEAGLAGHVIYLLAENAGLKANGMGYFFDTLGIGNARPLYHVAVGTKSN